MGAMTEWSQVVSGVVDEYKLQLKDDGPLSLSLAF